MSFPLKKKREKEAQADREDSHLECEVSVGEGDGVEVDAGLQVVGAQHGDALIESRLQFQIRMIKVVTSPAASLLAGL